MTAPDTPISHPSRNAGKSNPISKAWQKYRLFLLVVVIPSLLAVFYYGAMAADIYISESRFIIRSPDRPSSSPLGSLLSGTGFNRAQDDSYTVQDYIASRDAMRMLDEKFNLREVYAKGDSIARFPGWFHMGDDYEIMHEYYQKRVEMKLDSLSSIGILSVRAFDAQDAVAMNTALLERAEELVNRLNDRARNDLIQFATQEVQQAEEKAKQAALRMADYRNKQGVINPEQQTAIPMQQVARLQDEIIQSKALLMQLQSTAAANPQIPLIQNRIKLLEKEVEKENRKITGNASSLATKAAEFQRLALEKEFADRQFASALASLDMARSEAQRQQLYLERIAQPNLPDAPLEPRRLKAMITVLVLSLILWGVLSMMIAGIKEHID